jgi:hypothetical protein
MTPRALSGFFLALILAAAATPAGAYDQRTPWYSITVQVTPNSAPLFLTNGSTGVTLERYRSGDPTQMWALTHPDYPGAARVIATNTVGQQGCLAEAGWGCPFLGNGGMTFKIVNRASGACLSFAANGGAVTTPCTNISAAAETQKWRAEEHPLAIPTYFVGLLNGQTRCLTGTGPAGAAMTPTSCNPGQHGPTQTFRAQMSAEFTCTTQWDYNLCFVQGP